MDKSLFISVEADTSHGAAADLTRSHPLHRWSHLHDKLYRSVFIFFFILNLDIPFFVLTSRPRRAGGRHGSNRGSSGFGFGVRWVGDGWDNAAEPLLEDLHGGRERHHHLHHLRKPVDVLRHGFNRGPQLQGVSISARVEWYVTVKNTQRVKPK